MELESLEKALQYFEGKTENIVVQPKFMGSWCSVYLKPNIEDCYAVSRNGWIIKHVDLSNVFRELLVKFQDTMKDAQLIILVGELMPWSVLGADLIENNFSSYYHLAKHNLKTLQKLGFVVKLDELVKENIPQEHADKNYLKKYGDQKYRLRKHQDLLKTVTLDEDSLEKFNTQIQLYGRSGDPYIELFDICKIVYADKEEIKLFDDNHVKFGLLNTHTSLLCKPTEIERVHSFYNNLTFDNGYEGIIIKPQFYSTEFAPAIKVRNPEYLRIVYGPDYLETTKYTKLVQRKNIRRKLANSIEDFRNASKMLTIPYNNISKNNPDYIDVLVRNIGFKEEDDPRL